MAVVTAQDQAPQLSRSGQLMAVVRRVPYTAAVVAVMIVLAVVFQALWEPFKDSVWWDRFAYGLPALREGRWWSPVTGSMFATIPFQYVAVAGVFAVMVGICEWRMGTRTAALVSVSGQLLAVLLTAGFLAIFDHTAWAWANERARDLDVGFSAGAMSSLMVVAFTFRAPWRARTIVVLLGYCVINFLYVGILWDIEHLVAALFGVAVGWVIAPPAVTVSLRRLSRHEARIMGATLLVVIAAGDFLALLYPHNGPLGPVPKGTEHPVSAILDIVILLLVATGLHRGSRLAWWFAVIGGALSLLGALLLPHVPRIVAAIVITVPVLAFLVATRRAYTAPIAAFGRRRFVRDVVILLIASAAYVFIGFATIKSFSPRPSTSEKIGEVFARLFLGTTGDFESTSMTARIFLDSLSFIPLTIALCVLLLLVVRTHKPRGEKDREHLIELLKEYGGSNLSWMATWPDNSYFVTADGNAAVAFQVHAGTAIVLGDPVGSPEAISRALPEFSRHCEVMGYLPCVFSCSDAPLDQIHGLGWQSVQIAEDTIVDLPGLEFAGKPWQSIRTAMNRAAKVGVNFSMGLLRDQPFTVVQQARGISDQWVSDKAMPEMGFTLGGIDEALDPEVQVGLAVDDNGKLHGITSWLPVYGPDGVVTGWTLDVMRRVPDSDFRPVVEFMIASSLLAFKELGAATASLSGAPLARSESESKLGGVERLLDTLGELLEPWYGFRSLHQFKMKFKPRFEAMYMCYPDEASLPRIGLALTRAYLPDASLRDFASMLRT